MILVSQKGPCVLISREQKDELVPEALKRAAGEYETLIDEAFSSANGVEKAETMIAGDLRYIGPFRLSPLTPRSP